MSDKIEVNYEYLTEAARRFQQEGEEIRDLLTATRARVEALHAESWKGRGSDAFFLEMNTRLLPGLGRLADALGLADETIHKIANIFSRAEEEASRLFKQGVTIGGSWSGLGAQLGGGGYSLHIKELADGAVVLPLRPVAGGFALLLAGQGGDFNLPLQPLPGGQQLIPVSGLEGGGYILHPGLDGAGGAAVPLGRIEGIGQVLPLTNSAGIAHVIPLAGTPGGGSVLPALSQAGGGIQIPVFRVEAPTGGLASATPMPLPTGGLASATPIPIPGGSLVSVTPMPLPTGGLASATPMPLPTGGLASATPIPIPGGSLVSVTPIQLP